MRSPEPAIGVSIGLRCAPGQQKPDAGLQSRLRISKGQMLACNHNCWSAKAKCWLVIAIADQQKPNAGLPIAIAGQQEPNAGLQSRLRISKSQMPACNLARVAKKSSVWPVKLKAE